MPNVLSPRDLVFGPDNMDETVPHHEESPNFYWMTLVTEFLFTIYFPLFKYWDNINVSFSFLFVCSNC